MNMQTFKGNAIGACEKIGIEFRQVPTDGNFYTTNTTNDPKGRNAGRIKNFPDGRGGICWNWKSGERVLFINSSQNGSERKENKKRLEREKHCRNQKLKAKQNKSAKDVKAIWRSAEPANRDHPYFQKKHIKPYGLRRTNWAKHVLDDAGKWTKIYIENTLLVPLYNRSGQLRNIQCIYPYTPPELGRDKDFFPGAELSGLFWWLGSKTDTVCIAEGFATAATIHEETGLRVYIAFTAINLLAVGRIIRKQLPESELIFCADNDLNTKGNPGLTKATEAASAVGGLISVPPMAGDFNDYSCYLRKENDREKR